MSSYMRYGALSAKVRAMYGKRLRFSDFEHMAAMPSEQSVLEYLRGRVFTVEQVDFVAEYFPTGERV